MSILIGHASIDERGKALFSLSCILTLYYDIIVKRNLIFSYNTEVYYGNQKNQRINLKCTGIIAVSNVTNDSS